MSRTSLEEKIPKVRVDSETGEAYFICARSGTPIKEAYVFEGTPYKTPIDAIVGKLSGAPTNGQLDRFFKKIREDFHMSERQVIDLLGALEKSLGDLGFSSKVIPHSSYELMSKFNMDKYAPVTVEAAQAELAKKGDEPQKEPKKQPKGYLYVISVDADGSGKGVTYTEVYKNESLEIPKQGKESFREPFIVQLAVPKNKNAVVCLVSYEVRGPKNSVASELLGLNVTGRCHFLALSKISQLKSANDLIEEEMEGADLTEEEKKEQKKAKSTEKKKSKRAASEAFISQICKHRAKEPKPAPKKQKK